MSIDERFLISIAIMAVIAFSFRAGGLLVGTYFGNTPRLRRVFDILPACAIASVLGPSLGAVTPLQAVALITAAAIFMLSSRFLVALTIGTAILLADQWVALLKF